MEYTVKNLAQLSGVSKRTLRYYDQIGLLKPARINSSGYRIYGQKEVDLLQHILFYRELEFSLEEIAKIIQQPNHDQTAALKDHYNRLKEKRDRLETLMSTVKRTIANKEGGIQMKDKEKFEGFKDEMIRENEQKYGKEIREKYGEDIINASHAKLRGMSKENYKKMTNLGEEILSLLKKAYVTGNPACDVAQELAAKHKEWLMFSWSNYTKEAHLELADMYVTDERFTAYYDRAVKGGAKFLRDAIWMYLGKM
ncbi:MerR family transcriptional regulator [Oceanobacillus senegalensis]|uniref:MerR family transcriptional regulator n=1 Tax=Oceanobacillus senegalensis TaxID=1936063 RepID=UPI000A309D6D|nr:MerR family transcriptional regulator [Oceanobacillus senegalensis]